MSMTTIRMVDGLIVAATLDNGDEFFLIAHDGGISLSTKNDKTIVVETFSDSAIVIKLK